MAVNLRRRVSRATRLRDAILSLQPTAYWPLDDGNGPLRDLVGNRYPATVTGSPTYRVAAPTPIGRGIAWSGSGQYATTSGSAPTPAASMSALALISTTNATTASRVILARAAVSQYSWRLFLDSAHQVGATMFQSGSSAHAAVSVTGARNTGAWVLAVATFDGTTLRAYAGTASGVFANSTTTLSGSWHTASTAGIGIAHQDTAGLFPGSVAHPAYWSDRIITASDIAFLNSVVQGG